MASARPEAWVRTHLKGWNHEDWLGLLASLRDSQFWPMDEASLGRALETLRAKLTATSLFGALNNLEEVKTLLKGNPGLISSKDDKDRTPLHSAVISGYKTTAEVLLVSGAAVNAKDNSGSTPLHYAAALGKRDLAELLLASKADVDAKASTGWTPLHWAAYKGYKDVAELLLASKADVNAREDQVGATPLHWAALEGHKDMVDSLLAKGADRLATSKDGQIPLEKAEAKDVVGALIANLDAAAIDRHLEILRDHQTDGAKSARAELLRRHGGHK
jgi:ankyrin repeat protein